MQLQYKIELGSEKKLREYIKEEKVSRNIKANLKKDEEERLFLSYEE